MVKHLFDTIYEGYAYSYPHKHSYRRMEPLSLQGLWETEQKDSLFLYVHLPFCEMRCGFCNLFTIANPQESMVDTYLTTLEKEAAALREYIAPQGFGQLAVGGGTPTFLTLPQLERLFGVIRSLGAEPAAMPASFEMSPATITKEKLSFLKDQGIDRASIGIQSFIASELKALGRPQQNKQVYEALDRMKAAEFPLMNIDLIYGAAGQTLSSWLYSLQEVIRYQVEEVFIYPLYVRPLTGITKMEQVEDDHRFLFYREARQLLLSSGYRQVSMRMFQKKGATLRHTTRSYTCQEDGMIGMGAGARSYTKNVHYSSEYAVARQNIRSIIEQYILKTSFDTVDYGIVLNKEEQQRRYAIKSILHGSGLDLARYESLYEHSALNAHPLLQELLEHELACLVDGTMKLTEAGIDYSDAIGPRLYSATIRQLINEFELQ